MKYRIVTPPTSGVAFDRQRLAAIMPIPEDYSLCADGYLATRAPFLGSYVAIDDVLGCYRIHGSNSYAGRPATDLKVQRLRLKFSLLNAEFLERDARTHGLRAWAHPMTQDWCVVHARILSYFSDTPGHPVPGDSTAKILGAVMKVTHHPTNASVWRSIKTYAYLLSCVVLGSAGYYRAK